MTITSARRNHGNIELINSRTEELLVHTAHAAVFVYAHEDLEFHLGLDKPSDFQFPPLPPLAISTITNPSLVRAVFMCRTHVPVDIFPRILSREEEPGAFPRS